MQKIIIDTNILVSALIQRSYPFLIVRECVFNNKLQVCISEAILEEYIEVLKRPKFLKYPDFVLQAEKLIADIENRAKMYVPRIDLKLIKDTKDNRFLELAHVSNANYLVTGNTSDFTLKKYFDTQIVSPKDYWEFYKPI